MPTRGTGYDQESTYAYIADNGEDAVAYWEQDYIALQLGWASRADDLLVHPNPFDLRKAYFRNTGNGDVQPLVVPTLQIFQFLTVATHQQFIDRNGNIWVIQGLEAEQSLWTAHPDTIQS